MSGSTIDFWFDFGSTYSYLSAFAAASQGSRVRHRPFLLGPIFKRQGWDTSPFNIYEAKGRYMWRDMERCCASESLPLKRPSVFPRNGLLPARVALCAEEEEWMPEFCRRVFSANFAEDRDIGAPAVVGEILRTLDQDASALLKRAAEPRTKELLRARTERAAELGIFGAPTFVVGGELFWGHDRLDRALAWPSTADSR